MITIRPDAPERFTEMRTLIVMIRDAKADEIRKQHIDRLERIIDMLASSVEDYEPDDPDMFSDG